jgi:hypothetical protein
MIFPKIIVACPTYQKKDYCFERWIEQYNELTYPNKSLYVVENSKDDKNYKAISKLGIKCHYINPKKKPIKQVLAESHETLRQFVVGCNADFMLHWESDVFCDNPDIIQRLIKAKKPVINAVYPIRTGAERELNVMLVNDDTNILHPHRKSFGVGDNYVNFIDGSVKRCFSCGLGLCLIHKDILKKVKFRFYKENEMLPDYIFANDLATLGVPNHVDTGVYCKHENTEWFETTKN